MMPISCLDTAGRARVEAVCLNCSWLEVAAEEAHGFPARGLDSGSCDFDHLLSWIRTHLRERESG